MAGTGALLGGGGAPLQGAPLQGAPFAESLANLLGLDPNSPLVILGLSIVGAALVGTFMLTNTAVVIWAKRKVTAAFTDRIAPNRIGPVGLLIIVADAVRLLSKELIVPDGVDRPAWDLAPIVIVVSAMLGFAVIPIHPGVQIADPEVGLAYVFAVASLAAAGLVMAGYASNNKYSFIGALRSVAQTLAYEIPLVLTGISVVLFAGSLQMSEIVAQQAEPLVTVAGVSIPSWFAFVNPFAFGLFIVVFLAEIGRGPFSIPEAPTEIVAGHQTEYSSVYFTLVYLGEFLHMFLGGAIVATIFLGGPAGPILPGIVWFLIKMWGVWLFTQWANSALPRMRIDQLIQVGWKGMLVAAFANLVVTAAIVGVLVP